MCVDIIEGIVCEKETVRCLKFHTSYRRVDDDVVLYIFYQQKRHTKKEKLDIYIENEIQQFFSLVCRQVPRRLLNIFFEENRKKRKKKTQHLL